MTTGFAGGFDAALAFAAGGVHGVAGTSAGGLAVVTGTGTGVIGVAGGASALVPDLLGEGDGARGVAGEGLPVIDAPTSAGEGVVGVTGAGSAFIAAPASEIIVNHGVTGSASGLIPVGENSAIGGVSLGTGSIMLPAVLQRDMQAPGGFAFVDFAMVRGDTKRLVFAVTDQGGNVIDLSLIPSIRFQMSRRPGGTALVDKSLGEGVFILVMVEGRFTVALDSDDTAGLRPGAYFYGVHLDDEIGGISTIAQGRVLLSAHQIH